MIKIKDILNEKQREIYSVSPDDNVITAIKLMCKHKIGAVWVLDKDKLVGIFTEREVVKCAVDNVPLNTAFIKEHMDKKLIPTSPDENIHIAMIKVTNNRMRYLPVMEGEKFIGMVSIGDLVKKEIDTMEEEILTLQRYITQ